MGFDLGDEKHLILQTYDHASQLLAPTVSYPVSALSPESLTTLSQSIHPGCQVVLTCGVVEAAAAEKVSREMCHRRMRHR